MFAYIYHRPHHAVSYSLGSLFTMYSTYQIVQTKVITNTACLLTVGISSALHVAMPPWLGHYSLDCGIWFLNKLFSEEFYQNSLVTPTTKSIKRVSLYRNFMKWWILNYTKLDRPIFLLHLYGCVLERIQYINIESCWHTLNSDVWTPADAAVGLSSLNWTRLPLW
jgi:hypothetical protein